MSGCGIRATTTPSQAQGRFLMEIVAFPQQILEIRLRAYFQH
jgi:hypothetical protein